MPTYEELEKFKKKSFEAKGKKEEENFHRFTGFLRESDESIQVKKNKRRIKVKTKQKPMDKDAVERCINTICESLVCDLGIGCLSDELGCIGLKFIIPIDKGTQSEINKLGTTYRHAVSSGVAQFFDSAENKTLLDDRLSSLLPPTATKRFGCEKIQVVFDPIVPNDIYVEVFACPYLIGN